MRWLLAVRSILNFKRHYIDIFYKIAVTDLVKYILCTALYSVDLYGGHSGVFTHNGVFMKNRG